MNEIALLRRLGGNDRIIQLVESEVRGGSKGHLMLVSIPVHQFCMWRKMMWGYQVMECGEVDLARLIAAKQSTALDMVWVSYYWKQVGCLHFAYPRCS
jgi:serine/threonine-protein kinase TTK/MPS1